MADTDGDFLAHLQVDVRDFLLRQEKVLTRAVDLELHAVRSGLGPDAALAALRGEVRSRECLELRMPIIAPMSAGKSRAPRPQRP